MKRFSTISIFVLFSFWLNAQVPAAINFQAIARDGNGNPMATANIQIRLSVIDSAQGGAIVYQEMRALQTNGYGSFSFQIGVNPDFTTIGAFPNINWGTGEKHLKIDYDPANTFNFTLSLGVIKFVTVPYAFTAKEVVYINASGAQNGDVLIYNSATGKFEPGTVNYNELLNKPANSLKILPRIATKGQQLSVSFSGGDNVTFSQSSATCPNVYANVLLYFNQGTPTYIYPTDNYFIDSGRFDAVFDIPSYVPSGLYDIILAPSTSCPYTLNTSFKIY